jgi:hypothetical protein
LAHQKNKKSKQFLFLFTKTTKRNIFFWFIGQIYSACSLELSAAYFQLASSIFSHNKSANITFSRLFSAQAKRLIVLRRVGKGKNNGGNICGISGGEK